MNETNLATNENNFKIHLFEHPELAGETINNIDEALNKIKELFIKNIEKGKKSCNIEFVWM